MRLILRNKNNESIEISERSLYVIKSVEGLGATNTNIYSTKSTNQDGVSYQGNALDGRNISVTLTIAADSKEDMIRKRNKLLKVLNPKLGRLDLSYINGSKEREISVISELTSFPYEENFGDSMQVAIIELFAPNPFFKERLESKAEIAKWRPSFSLPLSIPAEGIKMGFREPSLIVNIFNGGDVETGMRIRFRALATLINPSLFNVETREYFKINKEMVAGEVIEVNTNFHNKKVEMIKQGVVSNIFNYIDLTSTFLQLDVGDNLLRYDADTNIDNLEVDIYYNPQSLGV